MTDPFHIEGPAIINVSGGRTSALMLRRILDAHDGTLPDDVVAAVADALDDAEKREREHVDEANALRMERDRLQRSCDEGLPRERIDCPACGVRHVEGPRHDDPSIDGRTRPHHTHRCYVCGHVWDAGRWSFGVAEGEETAVAPSEVARLDDVARGALDDLAKVRAELDTYQKTVRIVLDISEMLRDENARRASALLAMRDRSYALEGQCRELHRALATRKTRIARQRRDAERFRVERNEARAALRQYAPRCECGALATRTVGYDDCEPSTLRRVCDREACGRGLPVSGESAHAAAVRAAVRRENVHLLNTIESLSAQLCDTTKALDEARARATKIEAAERVAFERGVDASVAACRSFLAEQSDAMGMFSRHRNTRGADDASIGVQAAAECERRVRALKGGDR
jgi:hypothetical protein